MERIKLNLIPSGVAPVVHASQYDDGREFAIDLFEGDSVYVLDGTETLTVNVRKPDGHLVVESVTNTSDSYVVITTTEQMVAVSGTNYAKLKIEKGSVTIATLEFLMSVSRDPLENGDPSESFVSNLETQIASAVADQYDADSVVFDANPTAGHGVGFAVTSEGVANAVQDAKDYTDTAIGGLSIPENITDLSDVAITTPTNGEIMVYNNGSWENQANPASTANFAPDYDDTATYNTNDKVIYQGLLYICLEDSVTGAWDSTKWQNITVADYNAEMLPIDALHPNDNTKAYIDSGLSGKADSSTTYTKTEVDGLVPKDFFITISSTTSDSGISPFSYYGQGTKTDANIHNILAVSVYDTQFNNPAIAVFYGVSGTTYTFMTYSARSGNVRIRVLYN